MKRSFLIIFGSDERAKRQVNEMRDKMENLPAPRTFLTSFTKTGFILGRPALF